MSLCHCLFSFSYYDGDQEKLFSEAHVISPGKHMQMSKVSGVNSVLRWHLINVCIQLFGQCNNLWVIRNLKIGRVFLTSP